MTASTVHVGERNILLALASNVARGKHRARQQADELVPLLCDVPCALTLFDDLTAAVAAGDEVEVRNLLDLLAGEQQ